MNQNNESWRRAISPIQVTIKEVVNILDKVALRIVLITDESDVLIGTISDGDVRRGLLKGLDLSSSIESIIKKSPIVVSPEVNRKLVLQIMTSNKIQQIPMVRFCFWG